MVHSEAGEIAQRLWLQIPVRFPFIKLGPFVVMPNHIHGVLTIQKPTNNYIDYIAAQFAGSINGQFNRQYPYGGFAEIKNPMLHENISRVIRWYKGRCSFEIRKINKNFGWQSLFYDRIIRDQKIYDRVKRYVENNPGNWGGDKWFK